MKKILEYTLKIIVLTLKLLPLIIPLLQVLIDNTPKICGLVTKKGE